MAEDKSRVVQLFDGTAQPVYPVVAFENVCDIVETSGDNKVIPNVLGSAARRRASDFLGVGLTPVYNDNEEAKIIKSINISPSGSPDAPATLSIETDSLSKGLERTLNKETTIPVANRILTKGVASALRNLMPSNPSDWGTGNYVTSGDNASANMYLFVESLYKNISDKLFKELKGRTHNGAKVGEILIDGGHKTASPNDYVNVTPTKPKNREFGTPMGLFAMDSGILLQDENTEASYAITNLTINRGVITATRNRISGGGGGTAGALNLPSLITTLTGEMNKTTGRAGGFDNMLDKFFDENIKRYSTRYRKAANLPVRIKNNAEGVEATALPNKGAGDTINVLSNAYINNDGYLVLQKQSVTIPSAVAGGGGTATDALTLNKAEKQTTNKPINLDGLGAENHVALKVDGKVTTSEGFYEVSDERLKDIVGRLSSNEIDVILNALASPIRYTMKGDKDGQVQLGVVAQEIQKIIPEVVSSQIIEGEERLMVDYSRLSVVALYAVKGVKAEMNELSKRMNNLESKFESLIKQCHKG